MDKRRQRIARESRLFTEVGKRGAYNKKLNDRCEELASNDPDILENKQNMIKVASESLKKTYPFAKGYSQSKNPTAAKGRPMKRRISAVEREQTRQELELSIKGISDDIKILSNKVTTKLECNLLEEAECYRIKIRELEREISIKKATLRDITKKHSKAERDARYHHKMQKLKTSTPGTSDADVSLVTTVAYSPESSVALTVPYAPDPSVESDLEDMYDCDTDEEAPVVIQVLSDDTDDTDYAALEQAISVRPSDVPCTSSAQSEVSGGFKILLHLLTAICF
jgi:hypothetical protein